MKLQVNKTQALDDYSEEIRSILDQVVSLPMDAPGIVIEKCMGHMARCTEIHIDLTYMELKDRQAKVVRTLQLKPVMDLIEFIYRGASRLTEVQRQELEMSK